MLSRFTLLCEFRGGTYVSQVMAESAGEAVSEWCAEISARRPAAEQSHALAQAFDSKEPEPIPLDDLEGVWCESAECDGDLALLHIVKTQSESDDQNFFG